MARQQPISRPVDVERRRAAKPNRLPVTATIRLTRCSVKNITVMKSSEGYHKQGIASWYGSKFHGRRTSSGEPYDMHLATAAHKTLPLPTYAEVTNLDNGKKVIVKINDRGPFKHDRLIDMSYGAALRLGMTGTGTARVDVRVIEGPPVER